MKKKQGIYVLAFGHFCADINQTALSALLPFLITSYHYDYAQAATLVMAANLIGSLIQPLVGYLSDRGNYQWVLFAGLIMGNLGIAATGFSQEFSLLCLAAILSGIGVALFHPQAAKNVNRLSSDHSKGLALSIFSFGGSLGQTFGPLLMTFGITVFGVTGSWVFCLPCLLIIPLLYRFQPLFKQQPQPPLPSQTEKTAVQTNQWGAFAKLCILMFGRSIIQYGLGTFLALYWMAHLGQSQVWSNTTVTLYYAVGTCSTLFGGRLADRFGYDRLIRLSFLLLTPGLFLLTLSHNLLISTLLLLPISIGLQMVYSPIVVLGQSYLPGHVGLASGVTLGLAVSIGGITAPLLGWLADQFGLTLTMQVLAFTALIPLLVSFFLTPIKKSNPL